MDTAEKEVSTPFVRGMELSSGTAEKALKKISTRQKWLVVALGVLTVCVAALVLALILVVTTSAPEPKAASSDDPTSSAGASGSGGPSSMAPTAAPAQQMCTTPACVQAASDIMRNINPDVDPCEDFFEYACGSWLESHPIPEDRTRYTVFTEVNERLTNHIRGLLRDVPDMVAQPNNGLPAKASIIDALHQSCLNVSQIEAQGVEPLRDLLDSLGGWPMSGASWDAMNFNLTHLVTQLRILQHGILVTSNVDSDFKNSTANIIYLDQPQLGMASRDFYLSDDYANFRNAYIRALTDMAVLMGGNLTQVQEDAANLLDLETAVANMSLPLEARRDVASLYRKSTIRELMGHAPNINWLSYLRGLVGAVGYTIDVDDEIVVYCWDYLGNLSQYLETADSRTIQNYALWRLTFSLLEDLSKGPRDILLEYKKVAYGAQADLPRWEECVSLTTGALGNIIGRLYVDKYFEESAKERALEMITDIRTAFGSALPTLDWMDEETAAKAIDKADYMAELIGYADRLRNNTALDEEFASVTYTTESYFANILQYLQFLFESKFKDFNKPVDNSKWGTQPAVINAYYSPMKNAIIFPAGILQPPFYGADRPKYLNYGGIGMVIGHEIVHGFDDVGRLFNKYGNLVAWWDEGVIERYKEKTQCIVDQYGSYTVEQVGLKLNGIITQGENIADNGGLKHAHRAYQKYTAENGPEGLLPGLNYTQEQLFFLSFSQIWCGSTRDARLIQRINTSPHSPSRFRVLGTLKNYPPFSEAFQCPAGSPMNPDHKCSVW